MDETKGARRKTKSSKTEVQQKTKTASRSTSQNKKSQPKQSKTIELKQSSTSNDGINGHLSDKTTGDVAANKVDELLFMLEKRPQKINIGLLASRCLGISAKDHAAEFIIEKLDSVTHLRLDRENINMIDGLELVNHNLKNLYLQHNDIRIIEGLEVLTNLRFLVLSHNKISKLENLQHLRRLSVLDLSHNLIEHLDTEELPVSLGCLSLVGNPCQDQTDYRSSILCRCMKLFQLDGERLTAEERRAAGHDVESESDESDTTDDNIVTPAHNRQLFDAEITGVFDELSTDLFLRCQSRIQQVYDMHKERLMALEALRQSHPALEDRLSSRASLATPGLDSPDTTDNSRPATGSIKDQ